MHILIRAETVRPTSRKGATKVETNYLYEGAPLAMAYVPWQRWTNLYELNTALLHGTIFPELDLPFMAKGGACR